MKLLRPRQRAKATRARRLDRALARSRTGQVSDRSLGILNQDVQDAGVHDERSSASCARGLDPLADRILEQRNPKSLAFELFIHCQTADEDY